MVRKIEDDLVIVLVGEAGQGIHSIEAVLSFLLKRSGYNYFSTSEFMSRVRGGVNSTEIRVSSQPIAASLDRIDILIPLSKEGVKHLKKRITADTIVIGDKEKIAHSKMKSVQFTEIAKEIGHAIYANTVATGVICGILKVDLKECQEFIVAHFADKSQDIQEKNSEAITKGHEIGKGLSEINVKIKRTTAVKEHLLLSGAEAISLGALASGCNYVCGYPMSPATSVLENMAAYSQKFDIIVEQVEDEVGVINMALGAWYAGARAFVTTSGGGLALMSEGISLCGMIESPLVLHLAQRPGPATGLPTRTEQGDLNLALHAGHGDFPRIMLVPGTLEEGFNLAHSAFNLAEKYQVPVFILTDQFYVDSKYNTPAFTTTNLKVEQQIVKTTKEYKRYAYTKDGISPRGIPGYGTGNVCVDSDEHDEGGYITEDFDTRIKMVDKRLSKFEAIKADIIPPKLIGKADYKTLIICWGSTLNTVKEAVATLKNKDIAILHFSWIFPLAEDVGDYLKQASQVIALENNATGQFAQLLQLATGQIIKDKILKYNGLPFSVEEVVTELKKLI